MEKSPLGEFEELVLLAAHGLGGDAYTVSIQERIEQHAGRMAALGAIYTALRRLKDKGFLTSEMGPSTPQRGGKRKRMYTVTPSGKEALYLVRQTRNRLWQEVSGRPAWILS
ncbi:MAG: PadR family transcriptional regulator [Rhodothermales bacterium]|nr:PadR family transcriptional regulator [Rhodothermales bacterium]MBO6780835.1 PadR family transcriptional regulator [Rhodothermales bacterium]